jgi:hypothetical protein
LKIALLARIPQSAPSGKNRSSVIVVIRRPLRHRIGIFPAYTNPARFIGMAQSGNTLMHTELAEYGRVRFHIDPNALYDRQLVFDYGIDPDLATPRGRYEA